MVSSELSFPFPFRQKYIIQINMLDSYWDYIYSFSDHKTLNSPLKTIKTDAPLCLTAPKHLFFEIVRRRHLQRPPDESQRRHQPKTHILVEIIINTAPKHKYRGSSIYFPGLPLPLAEHIYRTLPAACSIRNWQRSRCGNTSIAFAECPNRGVE